MFKNLKETSFHSLPAPAYLSHTHTDTHTHTHFVSFDAKFDSYAKMVSSQT